MFSRWRVPRGPGTHVLMDGGILDVPLADIDAFYVEYIATVHRGQKVFVVEQKTDVFKFFVDLDYKAKDPLDDTYLLGLVEKMCSVVPGRCIVARAPVRRLDDGQVKSGVHIHWPETHVTRKDALAYRTKILMELDGDEWNERIDPSVYGGSGLRMLWSHKRPTGDPYVPWPEKTDISIELLRDFSIRTNEQQPTVTVTESHDALENYIRKYVPGQDRLRIKRIGQKGQYKWIQTDSRYCENIGQEHKSNHVWFSMYGDRLCQLCHDTETCHDYVGKEYILSPSIVDVPVAPASRPSILHFLPDHWFPELASASNVGRTIHTSSPSVLGSGSRNMGKFQKGRSGVRGRGGRGRGRTIPRVGSGEYS